MSQKSVVDKLKARLTSRDCRKNSDLHQEIEEAILYIESLETRCETLRELKEGYYGGMLMWRREAEGGPTVTEQMVERIERDRAAREEAEAPAPL